MTRKFTVITQATGVGLLPAVTSELAVLGQFFQSGFYL